MEIVLGAFTSRSVESALGPDLGSGVRLAVRRYVRRLTAGSAVAPVAVPALGAELDPPAVTVEFDLEPTAVLVLEEEARRCGTDVRQIVRHAVLVYLADLDRGHEGCRKRRRCRPPLRR
jgi:hypothetical protein